MSKHWLLHALDALHHDSEIKIQETASLVLHMRLAQPAPSLRLTLKEGERGGAREEQERRGERGGGREEEQERANPGSSLHRPLALLSCARPFPTDRKDHEDATPPSRHT
eukprot:3025783-Rhodomonas_salina.1